MDINKIKDADTLDLIFEGRYKDYGAYELRKSYNKRILIALLFMFFTASLFSGGAIWSNMNLGKKKKAEIFVQDMVMQKNVEEPEKKIEPIPPPPEPPKVEMQKFTPPKIVPQNQVDPEEPPPVVADLETPGPKTVDAPKSDLIAPPQVVEASTGPAAPPEEESDKVFTSVQIPSTFPGGPDAWVKFLSRNLNRDLPVENGAPTGIYKVIVSFIVERDGSIRDVKAENDPGWGTAAEAVRVIQKGPKWTPAIQNNFKVIYRHKQVIGFQVTDE
jgi:protein TonB